MTSRNPDPKPGRWILPLIIVGMVGFTYFFVQQLPGATPEDTTTTSETTTTTETTNGGEGTTSTTSQSIPDEVQAYVDKMAASLAELAGIEADLLDVNTQQDASPRVIVYADALALFREVEVNSSVFADGVEIAAPPAGYETLATIHADLATAAGKIRTAGRDARVGFEGPEAQPRRDAVAAFQAASAEFSAAYDAMVNAALATADTDA
ncbi:MAG: hypothetical protein RI637_06310 [Acidimicrobiia bacterium]|nr:hypothetical protein [Acidimicrobiia bacterium]